MSDFLDQILDEDDVESSDKSDDSSEAPEILRLSYNEAKTKFELAYAQAFVDAPSKALKLMNIAIGKATKDVLNQIALTDPEVKKTKIEMDLQKRLLVEAESLIDLEKNESKALSPSELAQRYLSDKYIEFLDGDAWTCLQAIREQVEVVANNLFLTTKSIDENSGGNFDRVFWVRSIQEDVNVYKNMLTEYGHLLRKMSRIVSVNKIALNEIKGDMKYIDQLRGDCESIIQLVMSQIFT